MPNDTHNPLAPGVAVKVNASPLQRPGQDPVIRTSTIGGPLVEGDRRIYLSTKILAQMLEVARSSSLQRVQVDRVGIQIDLHRAHDGHHYEVWTLIGANPRPEPNPGFLQAMMAVGEDS